MKNIAEILDGVKTMGIGGHVRPDGDCVGSCMALYLYVENLLAGDSGGCVSGSSKTGFWSYLTVWMRLNWNWMVRRNMTFLLPAM